MTTCAVECAQTCFTSRISLFPLRALFSLYRIINIFVLTRTHDCCHSANEISIDSARVLQYFSPFSFFSFFSIFPVKKRNNANNSNRIRGVLPRSDHRMPNTYKQNIIRYTSLYVYIRRRARPPAPRFLTFSSIVCRDPYNNAQYITVYTRYISYTIHIRFLYTPTRGQRSIDDTISDVPPGTYMFSSYTRVYVYMRK